MPRVFIPPGLRDLAGNVSEVEVDGDSVGTIIQNVDAKYPGFAAHLVQGNNLRSGWTVVVGGAIGTLGLRQRVPADAEVHFLPALGGG